MSKTVSYAQWSLEPYCIGMKLRSLRTQKRLTLSRLAAETGLSTALLSKLETDRMIPTLPTLISEWWKISGATQRSRLAKSKGVARS